MADGNYVRLGSACHCGEPILRKPGSGRNPLTCLQHRDQRRKQAADNPKCECGARLRSIGGIKPTRCKQCLAPPKPAKVQKQCPACRGIFVSARREQMFCSYDCRIKVNVLKPRLDAATCQHCSKSFVPSKFMAGVKTPMYCGKSCKSEAWRKRSGYRKSYAPEMCAWFAGFCALCGAADGKRAPWTKCGSCVRAGQLSRGRSAALEAALALHRAAAKVSTCDECGASYCRLYGQKPGVLGKDAALCSAECARARLRPARRDAKRKREALKRGVGAENVKAMRVFERDGWRCRLCHIDTPKDLRGTYAHNAPELDHSIPITRGGPHTYANTQCLCRSCNGFKSDRTMEEVEVALS